MITLNDYLYSGDTVFRIIQKYIEDLRKEAKTSRNEVMTQFLDALFLALDAGPSLAKFEDVGLV